MIKTRLKLNNYTLTFNHLILLDIKVWMLTGDKLETAQNIGYSCKLIQEDFEKLVIKADDHLLTKYEECKERVEELNRKGVKKALLMEGKAISKLLSSQPFKSENAEQRRAEKQPHQQRHDQM